MRGEDAMRMCTPSHAIDYVEVVRLRRSLRKLEMGVCLRSAFGFRCDLVEHCLIWGARTVRLI